jgi:hypothetical protein
MPVQWLNNCNYKDEMSIAKISEENYACAAAWLLQQPRLSRCAGECFMPVQRLGSCNECSGNLRRLELREGYACATAW